MCVLIHEPAPKTLYSRPLAGPQDTISRHFRLLCRQPGSIGFAKYDFVPCDSERILNAFTKRRLHWADSRCCLMPFQISASAVAQTIMPFPTLSSAATMIYASVPALDYTVQIRVYVGLKLAASIGTLLFTNALTLPNVHGIAN